MRSSTILRAASLAAILVAAPLTFASGRGVVASDACGQSDTGTCCRELSSICNAGSVDHEGYYYKTDGPCH